MRLLLLALLCGALTAPAQVKVWEDSLTLPTYPAGDPEPNPMFYFGRTSQGAQGRVYPYPLYDTLTHRKTDKTYRILYLENEYVRIGILPELGGRVFEGLDKTNGYHFFYRQHVIKPALIGLIGAWISGGIEWNIPHHHRASTFIPVQDRIESHPDGSKTVWVGELEIRHRMRWAVGYTLYPGRSYLEARLRIVNRTPVVNTMLAFANVAVHVNENYQVIFPPSTQYGTHHHKREFIEWPIARQRYGGADFTGGVDVSWYKNHQAANSIFAWNYEDDFLAGYDHGKEAGTMSVADHHIVPGKKLWTWGNGPRGRMWDKILTDDDGPYIELMVGAYSDNQPDYSWLQPFEAKSFEQYWYPFRNIGGVKNANLEAAVNLETKAGRTVLGFYTTAAHPAAEVLLKDGDRVLLRERVAIDPGKPYRKEIETGAAGALRASLSVGGRELVGYGPVALKPQPMPKPVAEFPRPEQVATVEELYLTGLRLEQFHNASHDPEAYWGEALRRDAGDTRVNTVLGIRRFKQARYGEAEALFRKALDRATANYTTPKDAEATYYLGLTLKATGRWTEADETLMKAAWNLAWRAPAYFAAAEVAAARGRLPRALDLVNRSLEVNAQNVRALTLKAAVLRHLERAEEARQALAQVIDPLDERVVAEKALLAGGTAPLQLAHAEEIGAEYLAAGLHADGLAVLSRVEKPSPLALYYAAYFAAQSGRKEQAASLYAQARAGAPDYVFPYTAEAETVLRAAPAGDPRAPYYLGNLLYDWQPDEALKLWERSAALEPGFAVVQRNIGVAYAHREGGRAQAIAAYERAVASQRKYALHFAELDELYEKAAVAADKRLALLEANKAVVEQRDDAQARRIALLVTAGRHDEAIALMQARRFAVWEGANLNVAATWTEAHVQRGRARLTAGRAREALIDFEAAASIPDNLPSEGRGVGRNAEPAYWAGMAHLALGDRAQARAAFERALKINAGHAGARAELSRLER